MISCPLGFSFDKSTSQVFLIISREPIIRESLRGDPKWSFVLDFVHFVAEITIYTLYVVLFYLISISEVYFEQFI